MLMASPIMLYRRRSSEYVQKDMKAPGAIISVSVTLNCRKFISEPNPLASFPLMRIKMSPAMLVIAGIRTYNVG